MGFFSKAWDGIKNTFKKIGKGIKSAVKSVGKFMDKIGIVGQIGLMFVLPGIGSLIGNSVAALAGSTNAYLAGLGKVLQTAGKFANTVGNAFKTVTDGVSSFVSNIGRGTLNGLAKMVGKGPIVGGPQTVTEGFQTWMKGVGDSVSNITSPFKEVSESVSATVESTWEKTTLERVPFESDPILEKPFELPKVEQPYGEMSKDFRFYEVPPEKFAKIAKEEEGALRRFIQSTTEYAKDTLTSLPERAMDKTSEALTTGIANSAAQAVGLQEEPQYNITNITNPIPEFNSTPVNTSYETAGLNYGALPDNRIQFFAAQQTPFDYGLGGWQQFTQLRPVGV